MKTFDKKDIFSWTNCEDAHCYVGKDGYFANTLFALEKAIDLNKTRTLKEINSLQGLSFLADNYSQYSFFLPIDKVKEDEKKKWRPFKHYIEFTVVTKKKVGDVINIMPKCGKHSSILVINGKRSDNSENTKLLIGLDVITLNELFNTCLWQDEKGYWLPFGVEE